MVPDFKGETHVIYAHLHMYYVYNQIFHLALGSLMTGTLLLFLELK